MGLKKNHTKSKAKTQRWRPGQGIASGRPPFQKLQIRAKNTPFCPKPLYNQFKTVNRREMVATPDAHLDFPMSKSTRKPLSLHYMSKKRPQMAPKSPRICAHWLLSPSNQQ